MREEVLNFNIRQNSQKLTKTVGLDRNAVALLENMCGQMER
jgi:hypothetical protein